MVALLILTVPLFLVTMIFEGAASLPERYREHRRMSIYRKERRWTY